MSQEISMKEALTNHSKIVEKCLFYAIFGALIELGEDARYIPWHNNVVSTQMREKGLYSDEDKHSDGEDL